jgi:hypothetical protein
MGDFPSSLDVTGNAHRARLQNVVELRLASLSAAHVSLCCLS